MYCDVVQLLFIWCRKNLLFASGIVLDFHCSMCQVAVNQAIMEAEEEDGDAGMPLEEKPSLPRTRNRPKRKAETSSKQFGFVSLIERAYTCLDKPKMNAIQFWLTCSLQSVSQFNYHLYQIHTMIADFRHYCKIVQVVITIQPLI